MGSDRVTRPYPLPFAIARAYLELYRAEGRSSRPRTNAYREARGGMTALAEVAASSGMVHPGTVRFHSICREVVADLPVEAGPEWLDRAAQAVAERCAIDTDPIGGVLEVFAEWAQMPCPSFTCSEAERLIDFARAFGTEDQALALLSAHADSDEPGDDHYREVHGG